VAVRQLSDCLDGRTVPLPLWWQHLPDAAGEFADRPLDVEALLIWRVTRSLADYHLACGADVNVSSMTRPAATRRMEPSVSIPEEQS
jgi:tagatose-1,6-bisphosphate aldolase non-catalytic subunit AgaZ/GatZ